MSVGNFPCSKNKKIYSEKISYISGNEILFFFYFFFLYFKRELAKPEKQRFLVFLPKKFFPYFKMNTDQAIKPKEYPIPYDGCRLSVFKLLILQDD